MEGDKQAFFKKLLKWPPFYTIQKNQEVRKRQLGYWAEILHGEFRRSGKSAWSLREAAGLPLFRHDDTSCVKQLSLDEVRLVLDHEESLGNIFWANEERQNFTVNMVSIFEIADDLYRFAKEQHLIDSIETFDFLLGQDRFSKLEKTQLVKALEVLEGMRKAEVVPDLGGVKFLDGL